MLPLEKITSGQLSLDIQVVWLLFLEELNSQSGSDDRISMENSRQVSIGIFSLIDNQFFQGSAAGMQVPVPMI
jgi:hypothetical protein